jgi:hypothetical protein
MTEQQLDAMKQALAYMAGTLKTDHVTGYDRKQCVMQNLRTAIHATELREQADAAHGQEPKCRYPHCSCNSKDFCDPKRQQALSDKVKQPTQDALVSALYSKIDYLRGKIELLESGLVQAKRTWVGLTDEEIFETHKQVDSMQYLTFGKAIEAKLKEKNT